MARRAIVGRTNGRVERKFLTRRRGAARQRSGIISSG
jgi:hypothetical protein